MENNRFVGEKTVTILRGLPGSGKSTRAAEIVKNLPHHMWAIHNTDAYHFKWVTLETLPDDDSDIVDDDMIASARTYVAPISVRSYEYVFDASKLQERHDANFAAFKSSVNRGLPVIVVDNTNTTVAEYRRYLDYARSFHYKVIIETIGGTRPEDVRTYISRNVHGVPPAVIQSMAGRFEPTGSKPASRPEKTARSGRST